MKEYVMTLNTDQLQEILKAVEILMRIKLKQPDLITTHLIPQDLETSEYVRRREKVIEHLKVAFDYMIPEVKKDEEFYRLYNILQAGRYAIHEAEHPETNGVDSYPPIRMGSGPLPIVKEKTDDQKNF